MLINTIVTEFIDDMDFQSLKNIYRFLYITDQ